VLGNQVQGPALPDSFEFTADGGIDEQSPARPFIRIHTAKGTFDFVGVTSSELWAAYNIVSPTPGLASRYSGKIINSPALVGLTCDRVNQCDVALHPAIAGTILGWDAIYADNVMTAAHNIAVNKTTGKLPSAFSAVKWGDFNYHALQWFDTPSIVSLNGGSIEVLGIGGGSCILQLRISEFNEKSYISESSKLIENALIAELGSKLTEYNISKFKEDLEKNPKIDARIDLDFQARLEVARAYAREGAKEGTWYHGLEKRLKDNEVPYWSTSLWPSEQVQRPCLEYPPLAAMNRVAKTIAILTWYQNQSNGRLPPLPDWVRPVWVSTKDRVQLSGDPYFGSMKK